MVAEDRLGDQVVDELLRLVLVHRDLLEHDLALGVDLGEERRVDHVGHDVDRLVEVVVGDPRIDDRVLARGGGVQLAAHRVEDLGDLLRGVALRALEEQVLDEVRDAGALVPLVPRPGADPEPERDRPDVRQSLGDDPLARIELGEHVLLHGRIVLAAFSNGRTRADPPANLRRFVSQVTNPAPVGYRVDPPYGCYRRYPPRRWPLHIHGAIRAGGHVLTNEEVSST